MSGAPIGPADAVLYVLEGPARRAVLIYLFDHAGATRQDIVAATASSPDAVTRALVDLKTLGYVTARTTERRGEPDHFTALSEQFVTDLTELRDQFAARLSPRPRPDTKP
ncbi:MarR family transcriptional regulator [Leifsonia sp. NPDC058292]|uniref:MarR family transcriptional regulator n=1 Tax=Leifsonia sp. NPDC058292 TaxID=3346428 RepID=UPI0036DF4A3C